MAAPDKHNYDEWFKAGQQVRREVLGAGYVDAAKEEPSRMQKEFAELTIDQCWGAVWTRPGLDRKTRSMLNIAMLGAMGKLHELEVHIRGAITNGVTEDEVVEILRQVASYAGIPCGAEGFRVADKVFKEHAAKTKA